MKAPYQPNHAETEADAEKTARLRQTRRLATLVLVALVALYLATFTVSNPPEWIKLARHMAEAGMIGGLADWFAVVALFRHPLGLRIPHTALLPRNKDKAATSVGQFFKSYFLDPAAIAERVAEMAPARRAAEWISDPHHAELVAKPLTEALSVAFKPGGQAELPTSLQRELRRALASKEATAALVRALGPMLEKGMGGDLLDDTLAHIRTSLDNNRDRVLEIVQDKSRWWVATRVDKGVSTMLVNGVIDVLSDLEDKKSAIRKDFEDSLVGFLDGLENSGAMEKAVHDGKAAFAASDAFGETLDAMLDLLRDGLAQGLTSDGDEARRAIASALRGFAAKILSEPEIMARFEARLAETAETAIVELRDPIGNYVTDVIAGWEAEELSDRFEKEIGPDLQFIRINGAVLGALIGGVLFFVGKALSGI